MEIPKPLPLHNTTHSLQSDMMFGWRPKALSCRAPVPLNFYQSQLPSIRDPSTNQRFPAIFHGYRPRDSYIMHRFFVKGQSSYVFNFDHPLTSALQFLSNQNLLRPDPTGRTFQGNRSGIANLQFDSGFQGGNLDKVLYGQNTYFLYMRCDSNTKGHFKWFYFRCKNSGPAGLVNFSIVNFKYKSTLFCQGMKPHFRSSFNNEWKTVQSTVQYKPSVLNQFTRKYKYFMLEFSHHFQTGQEVYFSLSLPYLYSDLTNYLFQLPPMVHQESLCLSLSGVDVPILTIQEPSATQVIFLIARVHPSQTSGSYVMQGMINYLISDQKQAKKLRKHFVFKIVPMCNPDGVILGNSRTSFGGEDLNRRYSKPDPILHPVPYHIKELVADTRRVFAVFDIHGHFTKKGSFFFGPYFPLHSNKYYRIRILPKVLSKATDYFRYFSCSFKNERSRRCAARLVFAKELKILHSYTVQNSLYGYINNQRVSVQHTPNSFRNFGSKLCQSIHYYFMLLENEKQEKRKKIQKQKGKKKSKQKKISRTTTITDSKINQIIEQIKNDPIFQESQGSDSESSEDQHLEAQADIIRAIMDFQEPHHKENLQSALQKKIKLSKPIKKVCKEKKPQEPSKSSPFLPQVATPLRRNPRTLRTHSSKSQLRVPKSNDVSLNFSVMESSRRHNPYPSPRSNPNSPLRNNNLQAVRVKTPINKLLTPNQRDCNSTFRSEELKIDLSSTLNERKPIKIDLQQKRMYSKYRRFGPFSHLPINRTKKK